MAKADYTAEDRNIESLEAGDKVQETVFVNPDDDARAFATTEGVSQAAYANYAEALEAHQSRADIETLADRRARENAADFADQDFMRQAAYDADGTAADAPRPGTVHGDAPKSA